jgi:hypothetical protein
MSYDPTKRDGSWTMIKPGLYVDPYGLGHIFPDEVLAQLQIENPDLGFEFSKEDYDLLLKCFQELCPGLPVKFIRHERNDA